MSTGRRFLFASSMLAAAAAAVVAVVVLVSAAVPDTGPIRIRTVVAAPLPPSPSPVVAAAAQALPDERPAPRRRAGPPIVQVGVMEIPKIGLVHPVFEGIELRVIDRGPGHWPGTAMPGERGNSVFAGHRTTHSHPFLDIDLLAPGDEIIVDTNAGRSVYKVTGHQIVTPVDVWITDPTATPTITLFACHPKRSARQRYVVRGELVSFVPRVGA